MRIAVAMSGGVDSSVAALLLARQGADVVGLSMHLWSHGSAPGAGEGRCCTLDDLSTARRAAEVIGVPHYVLNLEERFKEAVVKPFVTSYLEGETPIPCTTCNTEVKFKTLLERSAAFGCDAVATGHYARLETDPATGQTRLLKARDASKDQTYFLYDLSQQQLARARFPLGELSKTEVRELARQAGLPNWDKPDSQEVCFVAGNDKPSDFIRENAEALGIPLPAMAGARPGTFTDSAGKVLGTHEGTFPYTVGQRRGLGVVSGDPLYVLSIHPAEARVVVGPAKALESLDVALTSLNLIGGPLAGSRRVLARIRYRHTEQPALLSVIADAESAPGQPCARLLFDEPVRAASPGQSAVFFDPERPEVVLGGGVIARGLDIS